MLTQPDLNRSNLQQCNLFTLDMVDSMLLECCSMDSESQKVEIITQHQCGGRKTSEIKVKQLGCVRKNTREKDEDDYISSEMSGCDALSAF